MEQVKRKYLLMAFILTLTIVTSSMAALPVGGQAPDLTDGSTTVPTFLMLSAAPNPIGLGQTLYVNPFMTKPPLTGGMSGSGVMYENIYVEVKKPNGDTVNYGPYTTDSTGGTYFNFAPDQLGDWTLQAHYAEQHVDYVASSFFGPSTHYNYDYGASDSVILTVTVQEEAAQWNYVSYEYPEEYWTRPIYATNWAWGNLGGSWFGLATPAFAITGSYNTMGNFNPYTEAPDSGHIMWSQATHFGGQPGGPIYADQESNFKTTTIINYYFEPIIINGILYYTKLAGPSSTPTSWEAVDIRTGETLWSRTAGETGSEHLRLGQTFRYASVQEFGSWSVLYGQVGGGFFSTASEFNIYDAYSGIYLATIENCSSASFLLDTTYGHEGSLLGWYADGTDLVLWNSSKLYGGDSLTLSISGTYNWDDGIEWTMPIPTTLGSETLSLSVAAVTPEVVLLRQTPALGMFIYMNLGWQVTAGMDAYTGAVLWGPVNDTLPMMEDTTLLCAGEGAYVLHNKDTNEAYGYSLETGNKLWGPVELVGNAWSTITRSGDIAYGMCYVWDYGGYVNAINLTTGDIEWTWTRGDAGLDTPYGIYELWYNNAIADGKIILSEGKMYDPPMHPSKTVCIDAYTGETVWTLTGWTGRQCPAVADGYIIVWNSQDAKIYSIGKGPSSTTVTVGPKSSSLGTSVVVEGSVFDVSAGSQQAGVIERFTNGLPVAADSIMDEWMSYVYMQQVPLTSENFVGVDVHITGYDPNGNYQDYGYTCTDMSGNFAYTFEPEIEGTYQIIATFEGTNSYWKSQATTYLTVDPAPEAYPDVPTAEEIAADAAARTIAMMPAFPDVPTAEEIAADAAARTIAMMPAFPECNTTVDMPAYLTIDLVLIVLVVVAIIIGLYGLLKKK